MQTKSHHTIYFSRTRACNIMQRLQISPRFYYNCERVVSHSRTLPGLFHYFYGLCLFVDISLLLFIVVFRYVFALSMGVVMHSKYGSFTNITNAKELSVFYVFNH